MGRTGVAGGTAAPPVGPVTDKLSAGLVAVRWRLPTRRTEVRSGAPPASPGTCRRWLGAGLRGGAHRVGWGSHRCASAGIRISERAGAGLRCRSLLPARRAGVRRLDPPGAVHPNYRRTAARRCATRLRSPGQPQCTGVSRPSGALGRRGGRGAPGVCPYVRCRQSPGRPECPPDRGGGRLRSTPHRYPGVLTSAQAVATLTRHRPATRRRRTAAHVWRVPAPPSAIR